MSWQHFLAVGWCECAVTLDAGNGSVASAPRYDATRVADGGCAASATLSEERPSLRWVTSRLSRGSDTGSGFERVRGSSRSIRSLRSRCTCLRSTPVCGVLLAQARPACLRHGPLQRLATGRRTRLTCARQLGGPCWTGSELSSNGPPKMLPGMNVRPGTSARRFSLAPNGPLRCEKIRSARIGTAQDDSWVSVGKVVI